MKFQYHVIHTSQDAQGILLITEREKEKKTERKERGKEGKMEGRKGEREEGREREREKTNADNDVRKQNTFALLIRM